MSTDVKLNHCVFCQEKLLKQRKQQLEYYYKNKAIYKRYYQNNIEKIKLYNQQYKIRNKDKVSLTPKNKQTFKIEKGTYIVSFD